METPSTEFDTFVSNDNLMPSQWRDQNRRTDPYHGERRLWLAAFRSHLEDWRVAHCNDRLFPSPARRELWRLELTEWFNDPSDVVMSFRWYCQALKLDPSAARKRILAGLAVRIVTDNSRHRGQAVGRDIPQSERKPGMGGYRHCDECEKETKAGH
jgi:hypothetical protein